VKGIFSCETIINNCVVASYSAPNKITLGSKRLVTDLLATTFLNYTGTSVGLSKFVLYDVYATEPCISQAILGSFDSYDEFDPVYESEINDVNFPCLTEASIEVTDITYNANDEPAYDESLIYAVVDDNQLRLSVKIGPGFTIDPANRKFAVAALIGNSPNTGEPAIVYAIEQFPLMIKTEIAFFKFNWTCFI
jgi:hypothetical protein